MWSSFGHRKQSCSNKTMHYLWSLEPVYYNYCQCSSKSWALSEIHSNQVQEFVLRTSLYFYIILVLTIYTNHPDGILVHKSETIKFDMMGGWPTTNYVQISWTKSGKSRKIALHLNLSPYVLKRLKWKAQIIWFSIQNFHFPHVHVHLNDKYPLSLPNEGIMYKSMIELFQPTQSLGL